MAQLGVLAVSLASACSNSPPRATSSQQVRSGEPSGNISGSPAAQPGGIPATRAGSLDETMRKRGYKPAIYRGERVYCKEEPVTGSNFESKVCLTAAQIEDQERAGKDILNGNRAAGCPPKTAC